MPDLARTPLAHDSIGLLEGLTSTRAIRRYQDDALPDEALRDILFAATRAPSGSNRQPVRFVVLSDSSIAQQAKRIVGENARALWAKYQPNSVPVSGAAKDSRRARLAAVMHRYVTEFERVPVLVLVCSEQIQEASTGESVFPSCQNLLLAARALGYGGVLTGWFLGVEDQLRELLAIPDEITISAAITLGRPEGSHGPVRWRPLADSVYCDQWGQSASWAADPPDTAVTRPSGGTAGSSPGR
jgi:nitroreductase